MVLGVVPLILARGAGAEAKQAELENAIASAQAPAPLIHPALAEVYRKQVVSLHDALRNPNSRDEAFEISPASAIGELSAMAMR